MFLHFEDWSGFTWILRNKGLPHEGKIIKVFASHIDPREAFDNESLTVIDISDKPLVEIRDFVSLRIEDELESKVFSELGKESVRALFRFSWTNEFAQRGLVLIREKYPLKSAIDIVDGFDHKDNPYHVHLDIFLPESLPVLKKIVDFDNQETMVNPMVGHRWRAMKGKAFAGQ